MRGIGCLLLLVSVALTWGGAQGVYTAIKFSEPVAMTYAEYARTKPDSAWLELEECSISLFDCSYVEALGVVDELFIPIYPAGQDAVGGSCVVLATDDPDLIALVEEMIAFEDQAAFAVWADRKKRLLYQERSLTGLVQFGIELQSDERDQIAGLESTLDPDFIILEHDARPDFGRAAGLLAIGLLAGGVLVARSRRGRKKPPEPEPAATATDADSDGDGVEPWVSTTGEDAA